jgi:Pretoxin HINT domain
VEFVRQEPSSATSTTKSNSYTLPTHVRPPDAGREGRTLVTPSDVGGSTDEEVLYNATTPQSEGFGALMYTNVEKPGLSQLEHWFVPQTVPELLLGYIPVCRVAKKACSKAAALALRQLTRREGKVARVVTPTAKGVAKGACSFSGETLVTMADGSKKPISRVEVGDKVLATNPLSGTRSARRVTHVWVHQDRVIRLNVAGEVLVTTEDHPFWNATDHAWERADSVGHGDRIGMATGGTARNRGLTGRFWRTAAYNLTVQGVHTYHVGRHGLLVHNSCPRTGGDIVAYDPDLAIGQLTAGGRAKASQLVGVAESQGWRRVQNPNGPIKYVDQTRSRDSRSSPAARGLRGATSRMSKSAMPQGSA